MTTKTELQTKVTFHDGWDKVIAKTDDFNYLTRTVLDIDPITGHRSMQVFTDDGKGNGLMMFEVDLD